MLAIWLPAGIIFALSKLNSWDPITQTVWTNLINQINTNTTDIWNVYTKNEIDNLLSQKASTTSVNSGTSWSIIWWYIIYPWGSSAQAGIYTPASWSKSDNISCNRLSESKYSTDYTKATCTCPADTYIITTWDTKLCVKN
jgi:hypothetical protein